MPAPAKAESKRFAKPCRKLQVGCKPKSHNGLQDNAKRPSFTAHLGVKESRTAALNENNTCVGISLIFGISRRAALPQDSVACRISAAPLPGRKRSSR